MALPEVVSRQDWLEARVALLAQEKEATRQRDALNATRRRLPMVRVDKEYVFEGPDGKVTLADLFGGRRQLIVQHVMFGPDWDAACPSCTGFTDELSAGVLEHLGERDTSYVLVSRAPLAKLTAYQAAKGWTVPWYSAADSDFNYDFQVTLDPSLPQVSYNYRPEPSLVADGQPTEMPGFSVFLRDRGDIFHTYSTYARGADAMIHSYTFLDLTALGRQEPWEEPKDRAGAQHDGPPLVG